MTKHQTFTAMVRNSYEIVVPVTVAEARDGSWRFYAPGWRPLKYSTAAVAAEKLAKHPGFVSMTQNEGRR